VRLLRCQGLALAPFLAAIALSGCGGPALTARPSNDFLAVSPAEHPIDTNCTGCNAVNPRGTPVYQFSATLRGGPAAAVDWSVSGGDPSAGAGRIDSDGRYSPPAFLTTDRVAVVVTATLRSDPGQHATSLLTVTPGFLEPLTPENLSLGPGQSIALTGVLAEAGGNSEIRFAVADTPSGAGNGQGALSSPSCQRTDRAYTFCTVTYTAPATVPATGITYIVATAEDSPARTEAAVLLNSAGVSSNPVAHQAQIATPMLLGSSGGNNNDFDARGNSIVDCCSGTLGSLIEDGTGKQYLLSNNHVLAQSDHASVGDAVIQPGLIDNNCTPYGEGTGTLPVGALTDWLPLSSSQTNADAAIAEVGSRTVDPTGSILELGARRADGTLAPAPPGISSSNGKGESGQLALRVAKSGRTTGLTCGSISALDVDVSVDYFHDCAETRPYLTKTFTNQIALSGDHFSDAGDSGALVVDAESAEPVGLYFAGGTDVSGVSQGMANPAGEVLSELSAQASGASFSFVGGPDHHVSCLSFGDSTSVAAQARTLSEEQTSRAQQGLTMARLLVSAESGILGVETGKSTDQPGEAAVIVYLADGSTTLVPATIGGLRTVVIPTSARAIAMGTAPTTVSLAEAPPLPRAELNRALAVKQQAAHSLLQRNPSFLGIGVGQSFDNPREAALVIYVDRRSVPAELPLTVAGLRTHYIVMDRLHVTRSYASAFPPQPHCSPHPVPAGSDQYDPVRAINADSLDLH
jgi:hypothetical protein